MKCKILMIFIVLILYTHKISNAHNVTVQDIISLASGVQKFYKSSSIVIVLDEHLIGWSVQKNLITIIKLFSQNDIMSQIIQYNNLHRVIHRKSDAHWAQSTEPLYLLFLFNKENLEHFQKLVKDRYMSAYPWFVFMKNETGINCENPRGNPFYLELDTRMIVKCAGSKVIKKYYSVFKNATEVVDLAVWTPGNKFLIKNDDNYVQMKKELKGITLRLAKRKNWLECDENGEKFLAKLIDELKNISHFNTIVTVEEDMLGYYDEKSHKWLGLIKVMNENKADIAPVLFSMSRTRLQAVDFSIPLMRFDTRVYMRLPNTTTIHWSAYFEVLNMYAWSAIGIVIIVLSAVLGLVKNQFKKPYISMDIFFENFIHVWGIFNQQGLSEVPPNVPTQILYFSIVLLSLILNSVYSASITSYIAVLTTNLPFSTYKEFLRYNDYKILVLRGSRDEDLINSNDTLLAPLKHRLKRHEQLPLYAAEGFKQACDDRVAFYTNDVSFNGISNSAPCALGSVPLERMEYASIALSKDSPYTETINYYILRLMDHGIIKRLFRMYFYKYTDHFEAEPNVITFWEIMPILAIWAAGVITSLFVLSMEIIFHNLRHFCK